MDWKGGMDYGKDYGIFNVWKPKGSTISHCDLASFIPFHSDLRIVFSIAGKATSYVHNIFTETYSICI